MVHFQISRFKSHSLEDIKDMLKKGSSYAAILKRHPTLKSKSNLNNLKKYFEGNDTSKLEKLDFIQKHTWNLFKDSQSGGNKIHDVDLQGWAMEGAQIIGLTGFKATKSFIQSFRRRYGLRIR